MFKLQKCKHTTLSIPKMDENTNSPKFRRSNFDEREIFQATKDFNIHKFLLLRHKPHMLIKLCAYIILYRTKKMIFASLC